MRAIMDNNLFKRAETPDFENPQVRQNFADSTESTEELLKKEIEVNQTQQLLLQKRIDMSTSFADDLPASDPQYSMCLRTIQMDRIELDELKARERILVQKLTE